jgi:hypothetical protein
MKTRLRKYLESLGLRGEATDVEAVKFHGDLKGLERAVANALDYDEADASARTIADQTLRSLGVEIDNPKLTVAPAPKKDGARGEGENPAVPGRGRSGDTPSGDKPRKVRSGSPQQPADPAKAERQRIQRIRNLADLAGVPSQLIERAIDEDWSVERAGEEFHKHRTNGRQGVPADVPGGFTAPRAERSAGADALIAAMMMRHGVNDPSQNWPDRFRGAGQLVTRQADTDGAVLRACDQGHEMAGLTMVEVARRALELDGVRAEPTAVGIGQAVAGALRQGYGLANLTAVFTTSYTAIFMEGYGVVPDTTGPLVRERGVRDYKINERVSMGAISGPSLRRAMQEAEPVTFDDRKEVYRVVEFANQFTFDEQNLVDDSFDALEEFVPNDLGIVYGELRPNLVYATVAANAAMRDGVALFHANHGNLTGTAGFSVANLAAIRTKMALQREGTRNLGLAMKYVIVPPTLGDAAYSAVKDRLVVTGENLTRPNGNATVRHGLEVIEEPRLENGVRHPVTGVNYAGSASTYYGAIGSERAQIEVGYVAQYGRGPRIRSSLLTQGRFGINFDIQDTMGAKFLDWKGWQKATA